MIYLLHGPDELSRSEALAAIKAQIPPDLADLNLSVLDGKKLKVDTLVGACEAFPFIAEKRLVVVNDLLKHQKAGAERDQTRAFLEKIPATCDLVLVESDEIDKRNALFTWLKKQAEKKQVTLREFLPREGAELQRWLAERARQFDTTLEPRAGAKLVEYIGPSSRALANEVQKLSSYVGRGGKISIDIVEKMVADGQEQNLFAFIDELSSKRPSALPSLRHLIEDGQAAQYILFMVARQVRILLNVKDAANRRLRPDDAAAQLKMQPFVARKAMDQVRNFSDAELLAFHDRVLELDHASKTGRAEVEAGLELLVAETCKLQG